MVIGDKNELKDGNLRGVALAGHNLAPLILVNQNSTYNRSDTGKRYTMAHELCHLLHDRQYGREVGIASGNWAPQYIEKRANAFAGMLLMPPELVDQYLSQYGDEFEWTIEIFESLKASLRVGPRALMEHLHNQGYIDLDTKVRLEFELNDKYGY